MTRFHTILSIALKNESVDLLILPIVGTGIVASLLAVRIERRWFTIP